MSWQLRGIVREFIKILAEVPKILVRKFPVFIFFFSLQGSWLHEFVYVHCAVRFAGTAFATSVNWFLEQMLVSLYSRYVLILCASVRLFIYFFNSFFFPGSFQISVPVTWPVSFVLRYSVFCASAPLERGTLDAATECWTWTVIKRWRGRLTLYKAAWGRAASRCARTMVAIGPWFDLVWCDYHCDNAHEYKQYTLEGICHTQKPSSQPLVKTAIAPNSNSPLVQTLTFRRPAYVSHSAQPSIAAILL